jgi:hypothetical protein
MLRIFAAFKRICSKTEVFKQLYSCCGRRFWREKIRRRADSSSGGAIFHFFSKKLKQNRDPAPLNDKKNRFGRPGPVAGDSTEWS